jgi:hypothetical protein
MSYQTPRDSTGAIVASGQTTNLLLGTTLQSPARPSVLRVTAALPTAASGDGRMDVYAGGRQLTSRNGAVVPVESVAGRGPDAQLGWIGEWEVAAGELLELYFRNTDTANAIAAPGITWFAQLEPIA